jgi:hypothetical protein
MFRRGCGYTGSDWSESTENKSREQKVEMGKLPVSTPAIIQNKPELVSAQRRL